MIGQILNDIVMADAGIKSIIQYTDGDGNTAYAFMPNVVPQGVSLNKRGDGSYPAAGTYKVLSLDTVDTKDNYSGITKFRIQVDWFAKDYPTLNKIDSKMQKAMNTAEGIFTVTDDDDTQIQIDVGVSRHDETTEVFFDEAETHGRSTEYLIITNEDT